MHQDFLYCSVILNERNNPHLAATLYQKLLVVNELYRQQRKMYIEKEHRVDDRIVSIHMPHIRPIVRGKANADTEFGAKMLISVQNGFNRIEHLDFNSFNEGNYLQAAAENFCWTVNSVDRSGPSRNGRPGATPGATAKASVLDFMSIFSFARTSARNRFRFCASPIKHACMTGSKRGKTMEQTDSIFPGEIWTDTDGKPIEAHAGGFLLHEGVHYWYGESGTWGR